MLYIGCIADDFTGAGDAASFIRKSGLKTICVTGERLDDYIPAQEIEAIVIALKCRSIPAQEAVAQAATACRWLISHGAQHIYYKYCSTFDSTSQGNIGPITEELMKICGCRYTLLCPSLPVNGRTVRDGILYVNDVPLAESHMKDHPLNPMHHSRVVELMEMQSCLACRELHLDQLYTQKEQLLDELTAAAEIVPFCLAVDYCSDEDGERIADVFGSLPFMTGGSGLLEHLGRLYGGVRLPGCFKPNDFVCSKGRLLLAGSCSDMTLKQIATYLRSGGRAIKIDPCLAIRGQLPLEEYKNQLFNADGDILFYSSDSAENVHISQRLSAGMISQYFESLMGKLAVWGKKAGFKRLVVAGGETSGSVMRALNYVAYEILEDAAPGVPIMVPIDDRSMRLVLKSGNFGGEDFFLTALAKNNKKPDENPELPPEPLAYRTGSGKTFE